MKRLMPIAKRLWIPEDTQAVLWDMDGVLLDTLGLDLSICNTLLDKYTKINITLPKDFIGSIFAYHPPEFWRLILDFVKKEHKIFDIDMFYDDILQAYNRNRKESSFNVNPGILEILENCIAKNIKLAVVSNNPTEDVKTILSRAGITEFFDKIIGNDICSLMKKPAPDTYLYAAELLNVKPAYCVVVEDSVLGLEAGYKANCYTIGVATGGDSFKTLEKDQLAKQVYSSFAQNNIFIQFGSVTKKSIYTPNDFISHMIEHIAWRLGCEINLFWNNNDWLNLGKAIGERVKTFDIQRSSGVALGMIDDGSAESLIEQTDSPGIKIESTKNVDLGWFFSLRCEQINSGKPLLQLIEGLSSGLSAKLLIRICNMEDPHHTWEGVFRSIGIALNKMYTPDLMKSEFELYNHTEKYSRGNICIETRNLNFVQVVRETAETYVSVSVDFSKHDPGNYHFNVSSSIQTAGLPNLLELFAEESGFTIQLSFNAKMLNSSHVLLEDTGLVLGMALKEILILRMESYGVNGAGSSIKTVHDFHTQPVRVGVSVEGRKFLRILPFNDSIDEIKKKFLIGKNVCGDLFSEDLDDFLDGLAGGLGCSIMVHVKELLSPEEGWNMIFKHLGKAFKEVFSENTYRKGVPPGVKATLN